MIHNLLNATSELRRAFKLLLFLDQPGSLHCVQRVLRFDTHGVPAHQCRLSKLFEARHRIRAP